MLIGRRHLKNHMWSAGMNLLFADRYSSKSRHGLKSLGAALLLGLTGLIAACGGGGGGGAAPAPTLTSISVGSSSSSLAVGLTTQFTATGVYSDGTKQALTSVTWTSSTPTVASISAGGLATAVGAGSTTITATSGTISGTSTLTVTAAVLATIGVTPATPSIAKSTQLQFVATGIYTDNSKHALSGLVTWSSSTVSVATISNVAATIGLATGVAAGTTTITATLGTITGSTVLTVTPATLKSIAVTPADGSLSVSTTEQLTATGTFSDGTTQNLTSVATWSSSNTAVATVAATAGGLEVATAVAAGNVRIAAALDGVTGSTGLVVSAAPLASIVVTPSPVAIPKGTHQQFIATGHFSDNTTQVLTDAVTWTSNTPAVATINNAAGFEGLATGVAVGTSAITATLGTVTSPAVTLTVNPASLLSIAVTPPAASVINNASTEQFVATGTYTDGSTQVLTAIVTWNSATTSVATISNAVGSDGLATAAGVGTTAITATDVASSIVSPPVTLTVTPAEYVYVANFSGSGSVSAYTIGVGGALVPNGPAVAAQAGAFALAVDATSHFLYVANFVASSISQYDINPDGTLTLMTNITTGAFAPNGLAVHDGYLYVADYGVSAQSFAGSVRQYLIAANGSLTYEGYSGTAGANSGAAEVTFNAAGTFAYVPNYLAGTVSVFSTGAGGVLTLAGTTALTATSNNPNSFVIDGSYGYVANLYANETDVFDISPTTGLLTAKGSIATAGNPRSITRNAAGTYLYVPASAGDEVFQYSVGTDGALTQVGVTDTGANSAPNFMAIDPTGKYAYVTDRGVPPPGVYGTTVQQYTVGATGALAPMATATVASGTQPTGIIVVVGY
jgi:6-phosphogluconolactonase (cycloisomerase 2 family)/uncharacterized protein YjdB